MQWRCLYLKEGGGDQCRFQQLSEAPGGAELILTGSLFLHSDQTLVDDQLLQIYSSNISEIYGPNH